MEKIYVNENFPLPVVLLLRQKGYDVLTSLDAGNANQSIPDDEVLKFSTSQNRILLTLNRRDFIKLHFQNPSHSGIIVCTENSDFKTFTNLICQELERNAGNFKNQLLRVNKPS